MITSGRRPGAVGTSLQMAPAASPGERGTVSEFMAKPRRSETPSAAGSALGEG